MRKKLVIRSDHDDGGVAIKVPCVCQCNDMQSMSKVLMPLLFKYKSLESLELSRAIILLILWEQSHLAQPREFLSSAQPWKSSLSTTTTRVHQVSTTELPVIFAALTAKKGAQNVCPKANQLALAAMSIRNSKFGNLEELSNFQFLRLYQQRLGW